MKTLLLARHAKSDWGSTQSSDHERLLNERGLLDAPIMAAKLQSADVKLDAIVSSDASRALMTAEIYQKHLCGPQNSESLTTSADLYLASANQIIDIAKQLNQQLNQVMLVGHNPGMSEAMNYLLTSKIDMPTCSIAIIEFDVDDWQKISPAKATLLNFEYPKKT